MKHLQPEKLTGEETLLQSPDISENPSHSVPHSQSHKKTRDLPNLTECHACGFKVDVCTGKNGLRPLYSEWRVVLLCSKCYSSVRSSQICSYCFSKTSSDTFHCIKCRHAVHKNCFLRYKDAAPWSYACSGSEFSVCVDCWIPKPVVISRTRRRMLRGGMIKKKGRVVAEKGRSRVLGVGNSLRSVENVVEDANRAVEKKVEAAARAREEAVKKAVVARRAVEAANNALSLVSNSEESSLKVDAVKSVDGLKLTFKLHQHMSSSPRISKSYCLLNTSYLDPPKRLNSSVDSSCKTSTSRNSSGCDKHEVSIDKKPDGNSRKSFGEPSVSTGSLDSDSSTELNHLCMGRNDLQTSSKDCQRLAEFDAEEIGEELLKEGEGSCSDRLIHFSGENSGLELDLKQADSAFHAEERCNRQPDRYFYKYMRRNRRLTPNVCIQPKIRCEKIYLESQDSAVGVPLNCSGELRSISNGSCQSFHATLQASACESEHFREPS